MAQILKFPQEIPIVSSYQEARVVDVLTSERFRVVLIHREVIEVRLCASCLLAPMPQDEVLILKVGKEHYLMQVLVQANPAQKVLRFTEQLKIEARDVQIRAQQGGFYFRSSLCLRVRKIVGKIPFLEAVGGQWLTVLRRSWFKSHETMQDLGHYTLDTESMHETHGNLKIVKTPLLIEKTKSHHLHTDKFLVD